jgi:hyperosmotically inducible protein
MSRSNRVRARLAIAVSVLLSLAACDPHTGTGRDNRRSAEPPAHGTVDDIGISAAIHARLVIDRELKARHIDVDTVDGHVILQGQVPSEAARERAARLAATTAGVRSVDNRVVAAADVP